MVNTINKTDAPLEDLMAAMDVVDTLRHQQDIVERELDDEGRRERLLERLRDLYQAQGIDVSDHILRDGIDALEQQRFEYQPIKASWKTKLAYVWVSRSRWSKPVSFFAVLAILFWLFYFVTDVLPKQRMQAQIPSKLELTLKGIREIAKKQVIIDQAEQDAASVNRAISDQNYDKAQSLVEDLQAYLERLESQYEIRVVSRINENSGIWRVPPNNPNARNYYLIVEAVDRHNKNIAIDVLNQEDNQRRITKVWGLRVAEETFYKIASDKRDDGIIQNNKVGRKEKGFLQPVYSIATTGATITEW